MLAFPCQNIQPLVFRGWQIHPFTNTRHSHSVLWLSNIPLHIRTTFSSPIYQCLFTISHFVGSLPTVFVHFSFILFIGVLYPGITVFPITFKSPAPLSFTPDPQAVCPVCVPLSLPPHLTSHYSVGLPDTRAPPLLSSGISTFAQRAQWASMSEDMAGSNPHVVSIYPTCHHSTFSVF